MKKRILLILAHPNKESFCAGLYEAYKESAKQTDAEIRELVLADLKFDPILHWGYRKRMELEPDLQKAQEDITWASHIVFFYPTWWGNVPALLKGFIDRVFLPGFAYKFRKKSMLWDKLLAGRSAHLITTFGSIPWLFWILYGWAGHNALKYVTLKFSGITPVKTTRFGQVDIADDAKRNSMIEKVRKMGAKLL